MRSNVVLIVPLLAIVSGYIGFAVGAGKDRNALAFLLGAVAGPLGWIAIAAMEPSEEVRARQTRQLARAIVAAQAEADTADRDQPLPDDVPFRIDDVASR